MALLEEVSLEVSFEASKATVIPSELSLPPACGWRGKLRATASASCLPVCCHAPSTMVMYSKSVGPQGPNEVQFFTSCIGHGILSQS